MRGVERFAYLHPAILLAVLVFVFAVQGAQFSSGPNVRLTLMVSLTATLVPLVWAHGIHEVSARLAGGRKLGALFFGTEVAVAASLLALIIFDPLIQPAMLALPFAAAFAYLACLVTAAVALARAERRQGRSASILLTILQMIYWFVGAWLIRPRVMRLTAS